MLFASFLACLVTFTLAFAPPSTASIKNDRPTFAEIMPLYSPMTMRFYLNNPQMKADMKITKQQEAGIKTVFQQHDEKHPRNVRFDLKGTEKEKAVKLRAMDVAESEELFKALVPTLSAGQVKRLKQIMAQFHGNMLFELPEIRAALKMSDQQAQDIKALYKKLEQEFAKELASGKLKDAEAEQRRGSFMRGVPAPVRAALSAEQQRTLNDLLGEPFDWWKQ